MSPRQRRPTRTQNDPTRRQQTRRRSILVRVIRVIDGDSLVVLKRVGCPVSFEVRLHGLDAPEINQEFGEESWNYLNRITLNGEFFLTTVVDADMYGRVVGVLYKSDPRRSVNLDMITTGFAYDWPQYGVLQGGKEAENIARSAKIGVWQRDKAERPWHFRRRNRDGEYDEPDAFSQMPAIEAGLNEEIIQPVNSEPATVVVPGPVLENIATTNEINSAALTYRGGINVDSEVFSAFMGYLTQTLNYLEYPHLLIGAYGQSNFAYQMSIGELTEGQKAALLSLIGELHSHTRSITPYLFRYY